MNDITDIAKITELRAKILDLHLKLNWYEEHTSLVLAEEGFNDNEIKDIIERLTPPS